MGRDRYTLKRGLDPLVYDTSRWQERLFDSRRSGRRLQGAIGDVVDAAEQISLDGVAPDAIGDRFGLDVFARLYGDPNLLEMPEADAPWAPLAHGVLDKIEDFQSLRALVEGDSDMAALATAEMLEALAPRLRDLAEEAERQRKEQEEREKQQAGQAQPGGGAGAPGQGRSAGQGQGQSPGQGQGKAPGFTVDPMVGARAAARAAAASALERVSAARAGLAGLAPGLAAAPAMQDQPDPIRMKLAEELERQPDVQKIVDLAGRLERISLREAQVRRTRDSYEEVVDIERGGDLARILPSQLATLRAGGVRRLLALKAIADRQALQYRLEGHEPMGRGALVVLVDESSSMRAGLPLSFNAIARGITLACVQIARRARRPVWVIGFNGGLTSIHRMDRLGQCYRGNPRSGKESRVHGDLPRMALELIQRGCSGGTNFGPPLMFAMRVLNGEERPDLVFITDGQAHVPPQVEGPMTEAKAAGMRIYGIAMGGGSITPAMEMICDVAIDFDPDAKHLARVLPA